MVLKARAELNLLESRLDKAAKRGIVHRNLANRRKSRAAKAVAGRQFDETAGLERSDQVI